MNEFNTYLESRKRIQGIAKYRSAVDRARLKARKPKAPVERPPMPPMVTQSGLKTPVGRN